MMDPRRSSSDKDDLCRVFKWRHVPYTAVVHSHTKIHRVTDEPGQKPPPPTRANQEPIATSSNMTRDRAQTSTTRTHQEQQRETRGQPQNNAAFSFPLFTHRSCHLTQDDVPSCFALGTPPSPFPTSPVRPPNTNDRPGGNTVPRWSNP